MPPHAITIHWPMLVPLALFQPSFTIVPVNALMMLMATVFAMN
jgi:hypothetical protein